MGKIRCTKCGRDLPTGVDCPKCSNVNKAVDRPDLMKNITNFDLRK